MISSDDGSRVLLGIKRSSFSPISFSRRSSRLGLLADFNARLSLLYTDFKCSQRDIILEVRPSVEKNYLNRAIGELRPAVQELDASSTRLIVLGCYNTQPMDYAR